MNLEHSGRFRFLLMLQARDLKFLEHLFFAKNDAKSPDIAKLPQKCRQAPPGIKITA